MISYLYQLSRVPFFVEPNPFLGFNVLLLAVQLNATFQNDSPFFKVSLPIFLLLFLKWFEIFLYWRFLLVLEERADMEFECLVRALLLFKSIFPSSEYLKHLNCWFSLRWFWFNFSFHWSFSRIIYREW